MNAPKHIRNWQDVDSMLLSGFNVLQWVHELHDTHGNGNTAFRSSAHRLACILKRTVTAATPHLWFNEGKVQSTRAYCYYYLDIISLLLSLSVFDRLTSADITPSCSEENATLYQLDSWTVSSKVNIYPITIGYCYNCYHCSSKASGKADMNHELMN